MYIYLLSTRRRRDPGRRLGPNLRLPPGITRRHITRVSNRRGSTHIQKVPHLQVRSASLLSQSSPTAPGAHTSSQKPRTPTRTPKIIGIAKALPVRGGSRRRQGRRGRRPQRPCTRRRRQRARQHWRLRAGGSKRGRQKRQEQSLVEHELGHPEGRSRSLQGIHPAKNRVQK